MDARSADRHTRHPTDDNRIVVALGAAIDGASNARATRQHDLDSAAALRQPLHHFPLDFSSLPPEQRASAAIEYDEHLAHAPSNRLTHKRFTLDT